MKKQSLRPLTLLTRQTLLAAGDIIRRGFYKKRRITYKSIVSPVTQIDLAAQRKIVGLIRKKYPTHFFFAEESSILNKKVIREKPGNYYRWIIDPLDGTTNFVHAVPHSCVSVAIEFNGTVLAGGVYDPYRNELFMATKGKGSNLNQKQIRVSHEKKIIKSLFITGFPYDRLTKGPKYLRIVKPFLMKSMGVRRFGAAALDMAWIAAGRSEGYFEYNLNAWDVAAGLLLVQEAGGQVSDFKNNTFNFNQPTETLATNKVIHNQSVRLLKSVI